MVNILLWIRCAPHAWHCVWIVKQIFPVQQVLLQISDAHSKAQNAANDAQRARDQAFNAKNMSVVELERASGIASRIDEFTSEGKASPEDVETLAQEVNFRKFRETACLKNILLWNWFHQIFFKW